VIKEGEKRGGEAVPGIMPTRKEEAAPLISGYDRGKLRKATRRLARKAHSEEVSLAVGIETSGYTAAFLLGRGYERLYPNDKPIEIESIHPNMNLFDGMTVKDAMRKNNPPLFKRLFEGDERIMVIDDFADIGATITGVADKLIEMGVDKRRIILATVSAESFLAAFSYPFSMQDVRDANLSRVFRGVTSPRLKTFGDISHSIRERRIVKNPRSADELFARAEPTDEEARQEARLYAELEGIANGLKSFSIGDLLRKIGANKLSFLKRRGRGIARENPDEK